MAGSLREVGTAEWEDEVAGSNVPVLVEFWGDWCAPCHKLNPILEEIAEERSDHLKVVKSDTEANPELVVTHAVRAAPTLVIFSDGVERWRVVGFRPKGTGLLQAGASPAVHPSHTPLRPTLLSSVHRADFTPHLTSRRSVYIVILD
jgi:thioredoxin 1